MWISGNEQGYGRLDDSRFAMIQRVLLFHSAGYLLISKIVGRAFLVGDFQTIQVFQEAFCHARVAVERSSISSFFAA
jgi:hypothetical protein